MHKLSSEQASALTSIGQWLKGYELNGRPQFLTLGGYAGTGKTTLLSALRNVLFTNQPETRIAFAAYTGKATQVLKQKLLQNKISRKSDSISTLHSLMYYTDSKNGELPVWRKREKINYDIVIVDEASMVSEDIWIDLLSFDLPILAVGDHGQLPPINSNFNLMDEPNLRLEQIWRQAKDSPIVALATIARTSGKIDIGQYSPSVHKYDKSNTETGDSIEEILSSYNSDTLVLCGYNHTRQNLNKHIRALKGFESSDPMRGDIIVCLRNNRESGLSNGQVGVIEFIGDADNDKDNLWWYMVADFEGIKFDGYALREQFGSQTTLARPPQRKKSDIWGLFDFGYGLTVHKAQGSQAKRVLIFEERFSKMNDEDWRRWLYTAVTRAEEELYIVGL